MNIDGLEKCKLSVYSGTINSGHFGGPSVVAVVLEVAVVGRFYYIYLFHYGKIDRNISREKT